MASFPPIDPVYSAVKSSRPLIRTAKFQGSGDYEQRVTFGLNQNPKEWSLTFTGTTANIITVETFLDARAEDAASFEWTPPDSNTTYRWVCDQWTKEILTDDVSTVNATFRQVFEASPISGSLALPVTTGIYALTGLPAEFLITTITVLLADTGTYALNGQPAALSVQLAGAYIAAVEAADGQALESGVKTAITNFVAGCRADGIWNAIKASCILAGARTLSGALVPLVGTAPTNFNFWGDADPYWANVSLLLRMNGTNGSTTFTDSSSNALTVTTFGNAQINTAQSKFGGGSGLFDGNGDFLSSAYNLSLDLIGSSFTVEAWIYPTAFKASGMRIYAAGGGTVGFNGTNGIHLLIQLAANSGKISVLWWNGSSSQGVETAAAVALSTWSHIAVSVSGTNVYVAVNGVVQLIASQTLVRPSTNPVTTVGTVNGESGGVGTAFQGYIDDLRVTKGVARYTANFTPPTQTFPGSTADYDRKTGLVGDGSTKYLDSNYAFPTLLQNNCHIAGFFSTVDSVGIAVGGYGDTSASGSYLSTRGARLYQSSVTTFTPSNTTTAGFRGVSRNASVSFVYRRAGVNETANIASSGVTHANQGIYARRRNTGIYDAYGDCRLAFYCIGENLDLALLDARVTTLINAIAAAIP